MATLYGQKFRPYMAGRTFGVLDGLVSDTPQAFTMAHLDAALRHLGDVAAGQGPDAVAAAIAADELRRRMPDLAPTGVLAGHPRALSGYGESVSNPSGSQAGSGSGVPDRTTEATATWGEFNWPPFQTAAFGEPAASATQQGFAKPASADQQRYAQAAPGTPSPQAGPRADRMGFTSRRVDAREFDTRVDMTGPGIDDPAREMFAYPLKTDDPNIISGRMNNGGFYTNGSAMIKSGSDVFLQTPDPGETLVIYPWTGMFGRGIQVTIYRGS
jgi:hypothetical protein